MNPPLAQFALPFAPTPDVDSVERITGRMEVAFAAIGAERRKVFWRTDERWATARMQVDGVVYEHTVRGDGVHALHALERLAHELDERAARMARGMSAPEALAEWRRR